MERPVTRIAITVLIAATAAGCGSQEVLTPRPANNPEGIELTGEWLLRETDGGTQPAARETLVYVFLETGRAVKITQTDEGLFVSFDRSVVEEYRFGEQREISVGEVSAQRVSGWERGAYVIETLDRDGARLVDTYRLQESGNALRREIALREGRETRMRLVQTFDRL